MKLKGLVAAGAVLTALLAVGLLGQGCSKGKPKEGAVPTQAITGEPTTVVAQVNDKKLTLADVNRIIGAWKSGRFQGIDPNMPEPQLQQKAVDELINQQLLYTQATKAGMVPSPEETKQALDSMKQQFPDSTTFQQALAQQNMTLTELMDGYKMSTSIQRYVKSAIQDTINVTPDQARTYYDAHPEEFQHPEQIRARHILALVDPQAPTPEKDAAARAKIQGIEAQLKKGADFATLARTLSDDPGSRARDGDLGFFARGQMVAPFDSAAFALQPGQISAPVRTQYGYHIIKVEEKRPAGTLSFEEIQAPLMKRLIGLRTSDRIEAMVTELKQKAKIKRKI